MDKEVVKELIQDNLNVPNLTNELNKILDDEKTRLQIKDDYTSLKNLLQQQKNASEKAAVIIVDFLKATSLQKV